MDTLSIVVSSIVQLLLFALIPFIWWLLTPKPKENFLHWIGFTKPIFTDKKRVLIVILLVMIVTPALLFLTMYMFLEMDDLASSQFSGLGMAALLPILFYAFIQTGLSEELLFRGFILKRFKIKFGLII